MKMGEIASSASWPHLMPPTGLKPDGATSLRDAVMVAVREVESPDWRAPVLLEQGAMTRVLMAGIPAVSAKGCVQGWFVFPGVGSPILWPAHIHTCKKGTSWKH